MKNSSEDDICRQVKEEMDGLLSSLESHLIDSPDTNDVNLIFRPIHSFKSACNILGWHDLQVMAHEIEDWLIPFRDGVQVWSATQVDELKYLVSVLKRGKVAYAEQGVDHFSDDKFWIFVHSKPRSSVVQDEIKIVVIDDENEVAELFKELLEGRLSCNVTSFGHAMKALEHLRREKTDIVLTDYMMPEMNGLEFLENLRSFSSVPVIMITAYKPQIPSGPKFRENIFFVQKPFDIKRVEYYIRCGLASQKS